MKIRSIVLEILHEDMVKHLCKHKSGLSNPALHGTTPPVVRSFFLIRIVGVEPYWVHSALRPRIGLLCQPRVIMMMEKLVE
jgi:hypothetical protein